MAYREIRLAHPAGRPNGVDIIGTLEYTRFGYYKFAPSFGELIRVMNSMCDAGVVLPSAPTPISTIMEMSSPTCAGPITVERNHATGEITGFHPCLLEPLLARFGVPCQSNDEVIARAHDHVGRVDDAIAQDVKLVRKGSPPCPWYRFFEVVYIAKSPDPVTPGCWTHIARAIDKVHTRSEAWITVESVCCENGVKQWMDYSRTVPGTPKTRRVDRGLAIEPELASWLFTYDRSIVVSERLNKIRDGYHAERTASDAPYSGEQ